MASDNDPENTRDDQPDDSRGGLTFVIAVVAAVLVVIFGVVLIGGATASRPAPNMCSTSCAGFWKFECPGNRPMGTCFGVSVCSQPVHACGTNP